MAYFNETLACKIETATKNTYSFIINEDTETRTSIRNNHETVALAMLWDGMRI